MSSIRYAGLNSGSGIRLTGSRLAWNWGIARAGRLYRPPLSKRVARHELTHVALRNAATMGDRGLWRPRTNGPA